MDGFNLLSVINELIALLEALNCQYVQITLMEAS